MCEHVCVCHELVSVPECMCIFLCFQVFCIGYIIFEIEKKKKRNPQTKDLTSSSHNALSPSHLPPPLKRLGRLLGNCSLVTIPTSLIQLLKSFSPTPNCPAKSPSGPTATWPGRCQAGPAGAPGKRPNAGWAEMVPRASVSISAHCHDAVLCCLPPPLGCCGSVTVGLMGPFYTA